VKDAGVATRDIPDHVLDQLLISLVFCEAELILEHFEPGGAALIGDAFGDVFIWLWRDNPAKATVLVADLLTQLRFYHHNATRAVRLDAVLRGLPACLRGVTPTELAEMLNRLRHDVPIYVGDTDL
jgi:hypothetical protein